MRLFFQHRNERARWLPFLLAAVAALLVIITGSALLETPIPLVQSAPHPQPLNRWILAVADTYSTSGEHLFLDPKQDKSSPGVTRDLCYQGKVVAKGDPHARCYCSGIMLEIYMRACELYAREQWGSGQYALHTVTPQNFTTFRHAFYGATGGTRRTLVDALVSRGLGEEITDLEQMQPGDLMQIWWFPGRFGHSMCFKHWERDPDGKIMGFRYWSVQKKGGIGEATHWFERHNHGAGVEEFWAVRPLTPLPVGSSSWIADSSMDSKKKRLPRGIALWIGIAVALAVLAGLFVRRARISADKARL